LAYDPTTDVLYVASTGDNAIFAVAGAGNAITPVNQGTVVFNDPQHLHGPLGLVFAPNGDLITGNGDAVNPDPAHPSEIVEFTKQGVFVREFSLDPNLAAPFGLATVLTEPSNFDFAAVNDNTNAVTVYHRVSDAFTTTATAAAP
jgi:DNA-binding beta-propeller fold protein YncE